MEITASVLASISNGTLVQGNPDAVIGGFSTNSLEIPDRLKERVFFVPIVGERVDGHKFIKSAIETGASGSFLRSDHEIPKGLPSRIPIIRVDDPVAALQRAASVWRAHFTMPFIGITGSVGKTTTKEMIASALSAGRKVYKTAGNRNSQIGLPITVFETNPDAEVAVIEMGMSEFGEMARICQVAKPEIAVFTNIGVAHIGNLGSRENIRSEKLHITDCFTEESLLILNEDDELLREVKTNPAVRPPRVRHIVTYGLSEEADYRAKDIEVTSQGLSFTVSLPDGDGRKEVTCRLKVLGLHNVRNALAAFAVADAIGVAPEAAVRGLSYYEPLSMRGNLLHADGFTVVDDTYNASPDSMKGSIEILGSMKSEAETAKRYVVLSDVLELGEAAESEHRSVGRFLTEYNETHPGGKIDVLITAGNDAAFIGKGALETGSPAAPEVLHVPSNADAAEELKKRLRPGDLVIVKGSRGMHTEEIVKAITAQ